jgi:uncharacterized protein YlxW (UPF0749 family)
MEEPLMKQNQGFTLCVSLTAVLACLGVLLSVQFKSMDTKERALYVQRPENLIAMIRDLTDKRQKLDLEVNDLSSQLNTRRDNTQDEQALFQSLSAELNKLDIVNGSKPVRGPGLEITFQPHMPVFYGDITRVINELWAAGAEAIAVGDHRITADAYIFYEKENDAVHITVNNTRVPYPLIIYAIGNANNLEKGLTLPGGIIDNLAYSRTYPLLEQKEDMEIPAVGSAPYFYFMKEYTPPAAPTAAPPAAAKS